MGIVESFERDVLDCGVPIAEASKLGLRYARALETGIYTDWIELYVGIFATLLHDANRTRTVDRSASQRLLLLIDDDLGTRIFDNGARAQLRFALHRDAGFENRDRACQHA